MVKLFIEFYNSNEYKIYIGNNEKENWQLIDDADDFDLWLHIDNESSSHVIIKKDISKNNIVTYPLDIINKGANYCKLFSKHKNNKKKIKIIYTEILHVKKNKMIGSVTISNHKFIFV